MTSLKDHMSLALALEEYRRAMGSDAGRVAQEAARTALLTAADDCGYVNDAPILIWASEKVRTFANGFPASGRELDAMFRTLPRLDLEAMLNRDPRALKPSFDEGCVQ